MLAKARKKHLVGFETEIMLLEEDGSPSVRADEMIEYAKKLNLAYPVHTEYTHNLIEVSSLPRITVREGIHTWLETLQTLIEGAEKIGLRLYPFGSYHGLLVPTARSDKYYRMCETVLGPSKYKFGTGHSVGFHIHYCLPYGTFNNRTKDLRFSFRSKYKDQLINIYNMLVTIDPILTTMTESSPFVDGRYVAKDSRLMLYRDMAVDKNNRKYSGLYREMPIFGRLPRYIHNIYDLISLTQKRHETWKRTLEKQHPDFLDVFQTKNPLQFNWSPIRINRVGTIEYRGTDMNLLSYLLGASLMFKYVLRAVRKKGLELVPSDTGINEPFRIEGNKLYVPPYSYVHDVLQFKSATESLADKDLYNYFKRFVSFATSMLDEQKDPGLNRVTEMLESRKSNKSRDRFCLPRRHG